MHTSRWSVQKKDSLSDQRSSTATCFASTTAPQRCKYCSYDFLALDKNATQLPADHSPHDTHPQREICSPSGGTQCRAGIWARSHIDSRPRRPGRKDRRCERSCLNVEMIVICGQGEGIALVTATPVLLRQERDQGGLAGDRLRQSEDKYTPIVEMRNSCED